MISEEELTLKRLIAQGILEEDEVEGAMIKARQYRKLDIYNNQRGMLCIAFGFGQQKWMIRVPLLYKPQEYIREHYPLTNSRGQRKTAALWKMLNENKRKIMKLDRERKEKFM